MPPVTVCKQTHMLKIVLNIVTAAAVLAFIQIKTFLVLSKLETDERAERTPAHARAHHVTVTQPNFCCMLSWLVAPHIRQTISATYFALQVSRHRI